MAYEENEEVLDGDEYQAEEIDVDTVKVDPEDRAETYRWARIERKMREKLYGKKRR